ncbi:NAD-dependent epimerase/dehydratase family protein [Haematospirillum sp. H1815]|uniref:NAD-dependent epimerase/dehydratase family protein n=1 Tax=Haematospirillum sp. H1815 TaxID=2723108 RepID=UPI001439F036|nr:NAD-dependent epimerase/dehydratase family protein [Haematospirillum sp. H1815]
MYFLTEKPDKAYLVAAEVSGNCVSHKYAYSFIDDGIKVQAIIIDACLRVGVRPILFPGSTCIYPKLAQRPIEVYEQALGLCGDCQWQAVQEA